MNTKCLNVLMISINSRLINVEPLGDLARQCACDYGVCDKLLKLAIIARHCNTTKKLG